jgi:membrane protease YdiL (CAAX protease family)
MEDQSLNRLSSKQQIIIIGGIIVAVLLPFALTMPIAYSGLDRTDKVLLSRFAFWAEILLLLLYAAKVERRKLLIWNEKRVDAAFFLASVVAMYFLSWACGLVAAIPRLLGWHESDAVFRKIVLLFVNRQWLMVFTALTAGVTEEIIFRGYVLTRLALLVKNRYLPVLISALLFGAIHFTYKSLREVIFAFLVGVMFGLHYQKYRNIKVVIAAHFAIDIINLWIATHFYKLLK